MTRITRSTQIVSIAGASLFAVAQLVFYWQYAGPFGADPAPWSIDGAIGCIAWDLGLFTLFALHHSIFARPGIKTWVARAMPGDLERSAYVLIASLLFLLVFAAWRPVPGVAWAARGPWRGGLYAAQLAGLCLTIAASIRLDALDLAGLRVVRPARPEPGPHTLVSSGFYGVVRHPVYLGWLLMVWPAPFMTGTRLAFAAISTAYLVVGIPFEERGLRAVFGPAYDAYAARVRFRMVPFIY